jgi:hypothetical protein
MAIATFVTYASRRESLEALPAVSCLVISVSSTALEVLTVVSWSWET